MKTLDLKVTFSLTEEEFEFLKKLKQEAAEYRDSEYEDLEELKNLKIYLN